MFPGMPSGVSAAIEMSANEGVAIFFTGSNYCVYDLSTKLCDHTGILHI